MHDGSIPPVLAPPAALGDPAPRAHDGPHAAALPAVAELFREHYEFVWRLTGRLGVPAAVVDDAVQDVFVVLHQRRHEFAVRGSVRALLYGITRRVARRYRERAARHVELVDDPREPAGPGLDEELARRQAAAVLRDALAGIDEDKRMAFVLADIEGLPMPEVAECLEINLNTAYSRVRVARQLLQRAIARHHARALRRAP
ncbi:RNA polymerase sigma-70 factor, ECF subfamily [Nannocystis exedens]|uniref:RNA polymerase sigma-70 factor, ECF subfamily n=1 Tax=Nannocystis exedens TaxID=54 RepID=A0A1I2ELU3_9BACT|nr:sigma-70 family RNA polymerase sigma factor [Nannocystis exedens]PCC73972.1 ECF RNA polymerase sigma factor SigE [Nannocystis exedens]SFE93408.1 RNA polymerase sigma-70 factor, ECF subfamily [Nannocystis exedens]